MPRTEPHLAQTKIVATVGPACRGREMLRQLVRAGVDVFRVNMAHGSREQHEEALADIRAAGRAGERPVGILIDLAGPKIRLGQLAEDPLHCRHGDRLRFRGGERAGSRDELVVSYERIHEVLDVGDRIMLADGTVSLFVESKSEGDVVCRVDAGGVVRSRQGVNLPGVRLDIPSMTDEDRINAAWAASNHVDFIGLSFVRKAEDVRGLKQLLREQGSNAMVVAKIEKAEALEELDEIVEEADAVMVARGDLGVEIDIAQTPLAQMRIIDVAHRHQKPVIVATQMLDSMHHSQRPTRAEVSDVANAILDGTDACMLSGETAVGEYPVETVAMMNEIMLSAETRLQSSSTPPEGPQPADVHPVTSAVVFGAGLIANRLSAALVVVVTQSGATARVKSKQREVIPTIGLSRSEVTLRRMSLFWGITPVAGAPIDDPPALRDFVESWGRSRQLLRSGDRIVFVTGAKQSAHGHNLIEIHEVG